MFVVESLTRARVPMLGDAVEIAPAVRQKPAGPVCLGAELSLRIRRCIARAWPSTVISSGIAPEASSVIEGSTVRIAFANSLCLST